MSQDSDIKLAVQAEQISAIREKQDAFGEKLESLSTAVNRIEMILSKAEGGWRAMLLLGSIMSALGGVLGWFIERFINHQ